MFLVLSVSLVLVVMFVYNLATVDRNTHHHVRMMDMTPAYVCLFCQSLSFCVNVVISVTNINICLTM
jgi:hypothetical protein